MMAFYGITGAVLGFLLGWLLASLGLLRRKPDAAGMETELRRQITEKDAELQLARSRENGLIAERSSAAAERDAAKSLLLDQQSTHEKSLASLRETFRALSAEALDQNAPVFLRLAKESFESLQKSAQGDLTQRQEAIAGLLKPLEEQLKTYQQRLQQSDATQSTALGEVKEKLETLTSRSELLAMETEKFRSVLKSNQARGRWGEETLRRVVEAAGMSPYCDFIEQAQGEEGRPDMVVRLPGDRAIIVDAKVPDLDFLAALETADLDKRKQSLRAHADKLKETIRDLANKDYPASHPNSLDYVVLFLPAESLFSAALEGDRDLIIWAGNRKIMLATPASLIGLLRAVSLSWDQQKQTENTRAIAEDAQNLYERVVKFMEHFHTMRDSLANVNKAFNSAVGSYETRVRPQGEKLKKYGLAAGGKELAEIPIIEIPLRLPESP